MIEIVSIRKVLREKLGPRSTVRLVSFRYSIFYGVTLNQEKAVFQTHYVELELTLDPT
jgi:hypothetical protein